MERKIRGRFRCKQMAKDMVRRIILPVFYGLFFYRRVDPDLIVFADGHHDSIPYSMQRLSAHLEADGKAIDHFYHDFSQMTWPSLAWHLIQFMYLYAAAGTVVISDYFLPVAACKKKKKTVVVQLWHSGGLLKKFAYDAKDDIPSDNGKNIFRNYSWITVSAPACVPVLAEAMRLPEEQFYPTGISRTDHYYDAKYLDGCRNSFYQKYPDAAGKKIVLWAPTFRGNAANPYVCGIDDILQLEEALPEDYVLIVKLHPHLKIEEQWRVWDLPTEQLLPITDLLITDYSSIVFDYVLFERPFVLFAPDLEQYQKERGFYIDYYSLPGRHVGDGKNLLAAVCRLTTPEEQMALRQCREYHMKCCDGQATHRIAQMIEERRM